MQQEIWKPIDGFPRYQVSDQGRVKSLVGGRERILKPFSTGSGGYLSITLCSKGTQPGQYKRKDFRVNRLVAEYFCEGFAPDKVVHHINRVRTDNRAANLVCLSKMDHAALHAAAADQWEI